jgi:hypothetical protein
VSVRRLKAKEVCPLHRSTKCCGRAPVNTAMSRRQSRAYMMIAPGIKRFPDGREVCSPAALKIRKDQKLRTSPYCIFCGKEFSDYRDVDLCHIESKGMGGWRRNDSLNNLELGHRISNLDCGSRSIGEYMNDIRKAGKKFPCEVQ